MHSDLISTMTLSGGINTCPVDGKTMLSGLSLAEGLPECVWGGHVD